MTYGDFIAMVRRPGKLVMPIMAGDDVIHVAVVKSDFLQAVEHHDPKSQCPWKVYGTHADGALCIDLAR